MEKEVGKVFKYFKKPGVAALEIQDGKIEVGDKVRFEGEHTDFEQEIESMEIDGESVEMVKEGDEVGLKVDDRVRPNDKVILLD